MKYLTLKNFTAYQVKSRDPRSHSDLRYAVVEFDFELDGVAQRASFCVGLAADSTVNMLSVEGAQAEMNLQEGRRVRSLPNVQTGEYEDV